MINNDNNQIILLLTNGNTDNKNANIEGLFGFSYISKCNWSRSAPATHFSAVHTTEISIDWHLMGLCRNFMIFWRTREHPTAHLYSAKKKSEKQKITPKCCPHHINWYWLAFDGFMLDFYDILAHERTPNRTPDCREKQLCGKKKWYKFK